MNWYKKTFLKLSSKKNIVAGVIAYHGTGSDFENFEKSTNIHTKVLGIPTYFFTDNEAVASSYAKGENPRIMKVYLDYKKPLLLNANGKSWEEMISDIYQQLPQYSTKEEEDFRNIQKQIFSKYNPDDLEFNWDETVSEEDKKILEEYASKANTSRINKSKLENKSPGEKPSTYSVPNDVVIIENIWDIGGDIGGDTQKEYSVYNPFATVYMVLDKNIIKILRN